MTNSLVDRARSEVHVLINEDYDFNFWVWFPKREPSDLEAWWSDLGTVSGFFLNPYFLPGEVLEVGRADWYGLRALDLPNQYTSLLHNDIDSYLESPGGRRLRHQGAREEY